MDQFLDSQSLSGKIQTEDSEFTVDLETAYRKLQEHRVDDVTFPYWKFLQAASVLQVTRADFHISSSSISMELYSLRGVPRLETFCNQLPCDDPALEALKSSALALSSSGGYVEWVVCKPENKIEEWAVLEDGEYRFDRKSMRRLPKNRMRKAERLIMIHDWVGQGNFWEKLRSLLFQRATVQKSLTQKTDFFPVPLYCSGRLWVLPALEPHSPDRGLIGGWEGQSLFYEMDRGDNVDRFLTEGIRVGSYSKMYSWNRSTNQIDEFARSPDTDSVRVLPRLVFEVHDSLEVAEVGEFRLGRKFAVKIRSTRCKAGKDFLSYFCCEALMIPKASNRSHGWIAIMDRGLLVERVEADLGCPGCLLLVGRGDLKMDLGGTRVVRDSTWNEFVVRQREKVRSRMDFLVE